ncbi:homoserine dehydrogenase [Halanaerobium sp. MA284_MarDTE_T2]|uniref:homoserine dehydrogenase n=1 Tax=Halanaerobium sp. MA284_MarDTE_T2 TaxID=2183913 RepID=UPI000E13BC68|nr:homoserine dehydrogenase [Halanaerobium sp. MA284_MarDTE_T2]RCW51550.1 homoserine dehydrogenase [Halanaerobium sp. MA284_MarDTE_T2]
MISIALLGFGTVGSGFYEILKREEEKIEEKINDKVSIKYILVNDLSKNREQISSDTIVTDSFEKIIADENIDIIIELIGGETPALDYIKRSLSAEKIVITANKLLVANYFKELIKLAEKNKTHIFFEASTGGGIPVINMVEDYLAGDKINELHGILNGTTNYILSVMEKETVSMPETIKKAQALGYAEQDPSSDLGGLDALYKIVILANLAFSCAVNPEDIYCKGIKGITSYDIMYAEELGYKIKLIAAAKREDSGLRIFVSPFLIKKDDDFASTVGADNSLEIKSENLNHLFLKGPGAGKFPTGNAVIFDLIKASRFLLGDYKKSRSKKFNNIKINRKSDFKQSFYIRLQIEKNDSIIKNIKSMFDESNLADMILKDGSSDTPLLPLIILTRKISIQKIEKFMEYVENINGVLTINNIIPLKE